MNEEELAAKREQFDRASDYLYYRSEGKFFEIVEKLDCVFDEEFEFHEFVNGEIGGHNYLTRSEIERAWENLDSVAHTSAL